MKEIPINLVGPGMAAVFHYSPREYVFKTEVVPLKEIEIAPGIYIRCAYSKKTGQISITDTGFSPK